MKLRSLALLLLGAVLALTGCNTTSSRIKQKAEVFGSLPPADKERLRKGNVAIGDTPDMVYIAIGAPDRRIESISASARKLEWIYRHYYETYSGTAFAGYRRVVGFDPHTGRRFMYTEPCYADVYRGQTEENLRIIFEDGRVSAIEELKR
jgi:hypothetical protein